MSRSTYQIERDDSYRDPYDDDRGGGSDRMSFSRMVDDAARSIGGSEVFANLGRQARANPVPLVLVGIGLAWLMSGRSMGMSFGGSSRSYGDDYDYGDDDFRGSRRAYGGGGGSRAWDERNGEATWVADDSEEGGSWVDAAGNVLGSAASGVASAASAVRDSVTGGARYVARTARQGGETVYSGASRFGSSAYDSASYLGSRTRSTFSDLLDEEPLVLAAVGVAVGAAVGAMLPSTETENRYVGRYRDQLREEAERLAREQFRRGKAAATEGLRAAREEAESQGLSPSGLQDTARDIAEAAMDGAKSGASRTGSSSSGTSGSAGGTGGSGGSGTAGGMGGGSTGTGIGSGAGGTSGAGGAKPGGGGF